MTITLNYSFSAGLENLRPARHTATEAAEAADINELGHHRLKLAVNEAFANATHAGAANITIDYTIDDHTVTARITDDGPGLGAPNPDDTAMPDRYATHGRGIPIIRAIDADATWRLADDVGTTVTFTVNPKDTHA